MTVADSWDVAPSEARLRLVAERVIDVATGVGVEVGAVGVSSPPQLHNNSENKLHTTIFFMPSFCPAPLRPATKDAQNTVHRFSVSGGGIGVPPGTGVSPKSKPGEAEPPRLMCANLYEYRPPVAAEGGGGSEALKPSIF